MQVPMSSPNPTSTSAGSVHDTRRASRRTKAFSACDACQRRKSRCELINERGCHRCRTLGTDCTFGEFAAQDRKRRRVVNEGHGSDDEDQPSEGRGGLLGILVKKTTRIEEMVHLLLSNIPGQAAENDPYAQWRQAFRPSPYRDGNNTPPDMGYSEQSGAYLHVAGILPLSLRARFVSPIQAGLVSEEEMAVALNL